MFSEEIKEENVNLVLNNLIFIKKNIKPEKHSIGSDWHDTAS